LKHFPVMKQGHKERSTLDLTMTIMVYNTQK
jgi:hypothetical protein